MARIRRVDQGEDRIDDQAFRAERLHVIAELFDDGQDVSGTLHQLEVARAGIENGELAAADRFLDGEADGVRLRDHVLRLLVGDEDAGLLQLEAAREVLQAEERLADTAATFDQIHLVRHQPARAVVEQVDAADDAVGVLRRRRRYCYLSL